MRTTIPKLGLALGFTLAMGFSFLPLGCGTAEEAAYPPERPAVQPAPRAPEVPADIQKQLKDCIQHASAPFPPAEKNTYAVMFNMHAARSGRVRAVDVRDSTLGGHEVEACFTRILEGMTLPLQDLEPFGDPVSRHPVAPHGRALVGNAAGALPLVVLTPAVLVVFAFVFVVVIYVYVEPPSLSLPLDPPLSAAVSAAPTATAMPTTSATSIPRPRRYPNQTCDDDVLSRLEREKGILCDRGFAANCKGDPVKNNKLKNTPCSEIKLSLEQRYLCLKQRNLIQDTCFGSVPDDAHKEAIEQIKNGIDRCEALKLLNCTKGHPMSGL